MLEKPLVEFGIIVCLCPGIVAGFRIDGKFNAATASFQRFDHLFGLLRRNNSIFSPVERPYRNVF